tara:strand:+ start:814 stop:1257 length:444 start_codon:yes stop_codon:yes gene_type:complete
MASIRDNLVTTLVARIDAVDGFTGYLRDQRNQATTPVVCIVAPDSEDKQLATNGEYNCTYRCEVVIVAREEDADDEIDGGNSFRYLDRLITQVEMLIHNPDSWGVSPDYTDVQITGSEVADPDESNELYARVFVQWSYRHDYQDPSQ